MSLEVLDNHPAVPAMNLYHLTLKPLLEADHHGEFVAIDGGASLWALGKTPVEAHDALKAKGSTGWQLLIRIGFPSTFEQF